MRLLEREHAPPMRRHALPPAVLVPAGPAVPSGPRHLAPDTVLPAIAPGRVRLPVLGDLLRSRWGQGAVAVGAAVAVLAGTLVAHAATGTTDPVESASLAGTKTPAAAPHLVVVAVDGKPRSVWTTSDDVQGVLTALGLDPAAVYTSLPVIAALPAGGPALVVRTPKQITLIANGVKRPVTTTAATVGAAVTDPDVGYDPTVKISVPPGTPVVAGATYTVVQVAVDTSVQQTVTPMVVDYRSSSALDEGVRQVVQTGSAGIVQRVVWTRREDGRVVAQKVLSRRVISAPVVQIIAIGTSVGTPGVTYTKNYVPASGKVVGRAPNFAALAQCETHSRPRAVSHSGKYRGMYQFDLRTWHGVGGAGDPIDATKAEQTLRAELLYNNRGRAPWPYCGRFL